jgi:hypothetical protein
MIDDSFEPPLDATLPAEIGPPPALRAETLAAVARARRQRGFRRVAVGVVAAGLLVVVGTSIMPGVKHAGESPALPFPTVLADERARPAFASLDQAEQELSDALVASPDDPELVVALAALRDQRERLQRMIREAAS